MPVRFKERALSFAKNLYLCRKRQTNQYTNMLKLFKNGGGKNYTRNSSIELLKIAAMFCIVVFHVNMSLGVSQVIPPYHSTPEALQPVNLTLQAISYFGVIGNAGYHLLTLTMGHPKLI